MLILKGRVVEGVRDFCWRMTEFAAAFRNATGEYLYPGTLNVKVDFEIPLKEQFRVLGKDIGQPGRDMLFEICRINRLWAYRVRPCDPDTAGSRHGDDVLEIICAQKIPHALPGAAVTVELLRDDIPQPDLLHAELSEAAGTLELMLPILRSVTPPRASQKYRKARLVKR
jgi:CTP-dependent riboflavin kinase